MKDGSQVARSDEHPLLRLAALGALLELLWGFGLLVVLGLLSLMIWALMNTL